MTILFDLDGTLLPMDQNQFIQRYFSLLIGRMAEYGYEPHQLLEAINAGSEAMIKNDGYKTNEDRFWENFCTKLGKQVYDDRYLFEEFYCNDFQLAKDACGYNARAKEAVNWIKERGHRLILATNPVFPKVATMHRIKWAGLEPDDFQLITTYEDFHFCKPNPGYFYEILQKTGADPKDCLMVGNDASEDLAAQETGIRVFLITDCLINSCYQDISSIPQGSFDDLITYFKTALQTVKEHEISISPRLA